MFEDLSWNARRNLERGALCTILASALGWGWLDVRDRNEKIERFMGGVDSGEIEFKIINEAGQPLNLTNHKALQATLDSLALNHGIVTFQIGLPNRTPACIAPTLAIQAKDILSGHPVNELKPEGLQINLKEMNDLCERYGTEKSRPSAQSPASSISPNGRSVISLLAGQLNTPSTSK